MQRWSLRIPTRTYGTAPADSRVEQQNLPQNPGDVCIRFGEALDVVRKLPDVGRTFGLPTLLRSDAGMKFTAETVKAFGG